MSFVIINCIIAGNGSAAEFAHNTDVTFLHSALYNNTRGIIVRDPPQAPPKANKVAEAAGTFTGAVAAVILKTLS